MPDAWKVLTFVTVFKKYAECHRGMPAGAFIIVLLKNISQLRIGVRTFKRIKNNV
jgi:hypothetical protein